MIWFYGHGHKKHPSGVHRLYAIDNHRLRVYGSKRYHVKFLLLSTFSLFLFYEITPQMIKNILFNPSLDDMYITSIYLLLLLWAQIRLTQYILQKNTTQHDQHVVIYYTVWFLQLIWNMVGVLGLYDALYAKKYIQYLDDRLVHMYHETVYAFGMAAVITIIFFLLYSQGKYICALIDHVFAQQKGHVWSYKKLQNSSETMQFYTQHPKKYILLNSALLMLVVQYHSFFFFWMTGMNGWDIMIRHPLRITPYACLFFTWCYYYLVQNKWSINTLYISLCYTSIAQFFFTYVQWAFFSRDISYVLADNVNTWWSKFFFFCVMWIFINICIRETLKKLQARERRFLLFRALLTSQKN